MVLENANQPKLQELTGYTRMQISRIQHNPLFIEEVDRLTNKLEEHEITQRREALAVVFNEIKDIVAMQCQLAKTAKSEGVRSQACDRAMSYIFQKKDFSRDDEERTKYIAVQVAPRDSVKDDPDVSPVAAEALRNVIPFEEMNNG